MNENDVFNSLDLTDLPPIPVRPKVTVLEGEDWGEVRIFFGEDEFPHEVWDVKANFYGGGETKVTIELPASAVEFKRN